MRYIKIFTCCLKPHNNNMFVFEAHANTWLSSTNSPFNATFRTFKFNVSQISGRTAPTAPFAKLMTIFAVNFLDAQTTR